MITKAIGFSNKYYTAWEISEEVVTGYRGSYKVIHYNYLRNLSYDFKTAKKKYPGIFIEGLRGKNHSFEKHESIYDPDCFAFGKYEGKLFTEVNDNPYLAWYFENTGDERHKEQIKPILEDAGYVFDDSFCYSPDEWKKRLKQIDEYEEAKNKINNKDVNFITSKNLTTTEEDKGYIIENNITYNFDNVKEYWYNNYPYGLPTINGKAKRIKGKKIIIEDFEIVNIENR